MRDNKIIDKQISISNIIDTAQYLKQYYEQWANKFALEESKNRNLDYDLKDYTYYSGSCSIKYTIDFKDGKALTETSYEWFVENISDIKTIDSITISFNCAYWTKEIGVISKDYDNYNKIYVSLWFRENDAYIDIETTLQENEGRNLYNDIVRLFDKCEKRYDNIIKNKGKIMQFYCVAIGLILTYLLFAIYKIVEMTSEGGMSEFIVELMENKYIIVIGQWFLALVLGNIFANFSIFNIYKPIIPETMYVGYDYTMNRSLTKDDVNDYKSHSEVQIGKYYDAKYRREKIKRKYSFAKVIIFLQLIASVVIFIVMNSVS